MSSPPPTALHHVVVNKDSKRYNGMKSVDRQEGPRFSAMDTGVSQSGSSQRPRLQIGSKQDAAMHMDPLPQNGDEGDAARNSAKRKNFSDASRQEDGMAASHFDADDARRDESMDEIGDGTFRPLPMMQDEDEAWLESGSLAETKGGEESNDDDLLAKAAEWKQQLEQVLNGYEMMRVKNAITLDCLYMAAGTIENDYRSTMAKYTA